MQADRTGYDDGKPYVATLVGGWGAVPEPAGDGDVASGARHVRGGAARAVPAATRRPPTDYVVTVPPPPPAGPDPGLQDVWDQGHWAPDMGGPPPPVPTQPQRDAVRAMGSAGGRPTAGAQHHVGVDRHRPATSTRRSCKSPSRSKPSPTSN